MALRYDRQFLVIATCVLWPYQQPTLDGWAQTLADLLRKFDAGTTIRVRSTQNTREREAEAPSRQQPPRGTSKSPADKPNNDNVRRLTVNIELTTSAHSDEIARQINRMLPIYIGYKQADGTNEPAIGIDVSHRLRLAAA